MNTATSVKVELATKRIIGIGSSIWASMGDRAENRRAKVLQKPRAVAAKRVGNRYGLDK